MDIKQATDQIKGAVQAYMSRDSHGLLRIPFHMQRPIIMFGPPGVGKTAIVNQIAEELDINFVSYSITHHTRQSALGLPFIFKDEFGGVEYNVSEYTMSEIIAAVYRAQEESGVNQGILFLDEVNCVSETLAPAMLQFLQYKTFGMHRLPEGWVIITAGNPPEYNRAAREFDPAMLDRMKRIDVEPNLPVWMNYAAAHGMHPAITTFLDSKPLSFYKVQSGVKGTKLVTPRGWEDLSRMLQAYEAEELEVDVQLVRQYLQEETISSEFFAYYQLFRKYQDTYKVSTILEGGDTTAVGKRAKEAAFDERAALVGLMVDTLLVHVHEAVELEEALTFVRKDVLAMKDRLQAGDPTVVQETIDMLRGASDVGTRVKGQVGNYAVVKAERRRTLDAIGKAVYASIPEDKDMYEVALEVFNDTCAHQRELAQHCVTETDNAFAFLDGVFSEIGQEPLILVTKLSADPTMVKLVSEYGGTGYLKHNRSLLFTERSVELFQAIKDLGAEEEEAQE